MNLEGLPKDAKEIPGFPGYYATPNGDVWSGPKKTYCGYRKLRPSKIRGGRLAVHPVVNGRVFTKSIHRLILETFIGPCPKDRECCHKNDIPTDNRLENLRWDTRSENMKEGFYNGRYKQGEEHSWSKLTAWQVRIIKRLLEHPKEFTQKDIGNIFGVARRTISHIKCGSSW